MLERWRGKPTAPGLVAPPPEWLRHGAAEPAERPITDAQGAITRTIREIAKTRRRAVPTWHANIWFETLS